MKRRQRSWSWLWTLETLVQKMSTVRSQWWALRKRIAEASSKMKMMEMNIMITWRCLLELSIDSVRPLALICASNNLILCRMIQPRCALALPITHVLLFFCLPGQGEATSSLVEEFEAVYRCFEEREKVNTTHNPHVLLVLRPLLAPP